MGIRTSAGGSPPPERARWRHLADALDGIASRRQVTRCTPFANHPNNHLSNPLKKIDNFGIDVRRSFAVPSADFEG